VCTFKVVVWYLSVKCTFIYLIFVCPKYIPGIITRKSINTNENTEKIFPSVNFRGILPTKIFPRYIPRELQWGKKFKTKQKQMMTCHFYQQNYRRNKFRR
jgi:hypothetical protein